MATEKPAKTKRIRKPRPKKLRMFDGNAPSGGVLLQTFGNWALYERERGHTVLYQSFKLVYIGIKERKANYWLAFSNVHKCFSGRDAQILKVNDIKLHDELVNWLVKRALAMPAL